MFMAYQPVRQFPIVIRWGRPPEVSFKVCAYRAPHGGTRHRHRGGCRRRLQPDQDNQTKSSYFKQIQIYCQCVFLSDFSFYYYVVKKVKE